MGGIAIPVSHRSIGLYLSLHRTVEAGSSQDNAKLCNLLDAILRHGCQGSDVSWPSRAKTEVRYGAPGCHA
jgi:hypothetical protein